MWFDNFALIQRYFPLKFSTAFLRTLDLNPLLVQADPGENHRYCKEKIINKVPETLDEKIWLYIKEKINIKEKNFPNIEGIIIGKAIYDGNIDIKELSRII